MKSCWFVHLYLLVLSHVIVNLPSVYFYKVKLLICYTMELMWCSLISSVRLNRGFACQLQVVLLHIMHILAQCVDNILYIKVMIIFELISSCMMHLFCTYDFLNHLT